MPQLVHKLSNIDIQTMRADCQKCDTRVHLQSRSGKYWCKVRAVGTKKLENPNGRRGRQKSRKCEHCGDKLYGSGRVRFCLECLGKDGRGSRAHNLFKRYRLTLAEYEAMYFDQDGSCLICRETEAQVVDHDHSTGRVRGLLCQSCNRGLGQFMDSPIVVESALDYLKG